MQLSFWVLNCQIAAVQGYMKKSWMKETVMALCELLMKWSGGAGVNLWDDPFQVLSSACHSVWTSRSRHRLAPMTHIYEYEPCRETNVLGSNSKVPAIVTLWRGIIIRFERKQLPLVTMTSRCSLSSDPEAKEAQCNTKYPSLHPKSNMLYQHLIGWYGGQSDWLFINWLPVKLTTGAGVLFV